MRHLNRLKLIRQRQIRERTAKLAFLPTMYGDAERQSQIHEIEAEQAALEREREEAANELEAFRLEIDQAIADGELDNKQREKISKMAMRTVERKRKS